MFLDKEMSATIAGNQAVIPWSTPQPSHYWMSYPDYYFFANIKKIKLVTYNKYTLLLSQMDNESCMLIKQKKNI